MTLREILALCKQRLMLSKKLHLIKSTALDMLILLLKISVRVEFQGCLTFLMLLTLMLSGTTT